MRCQGRQELRVGGPRPDGAAVAERELLSGIVNRALASLRGERLVTRASRYDGTHWHWHDGARILSLDLPADGRVLVVGAGKAAANLALGLEQVLGDGIDDGLILVKDGHRQALRRVRQIEAGHPLPDRRGLAGTRQIRALLAGLRPQDRVFVVITGGASSLLVAPLAGLGLEDKSELTCRLLHSSASISEINAVRCALSQVKGGGLAQWLSPAKAVALVVSDVEGDDLGLVGSGPATNSRGRAEPPLAILARHGLLESLPPQLAEALSQPVSLLPATAEALPAIMVANSAALVEAVISEARASGLQVEAPNLEMFGDTHAEARKFCARLSELARSGVSAPRLLVAAGETTLTVSGTGLGGRNQEFALVAARELAGHKGCAVLAVGSDGTDGPTDAAGAFIAGATWARAQALGLNAAAALANNDSHNLFARLGDLHLTGPTGTNVMDIVIGLVQPARSPRNP